MQDRNINEYLRRHIRTVPNWPAPGVQFRDITPLLQDPKVFRVLIDAFVHRYMDADKRPDVVAGLDARGFILGAVIAYELNVGFVPIRKKGKLPFTTVEETYDTMDALKSEHPGIVDIDPLGLTWTGNYDMRALRITNLATAVNYAASQGVSAISNSYGGSDSAQTSAYNHPGIAITASTGDAGYGVESPASYDSVIAVGGTSLSRASGTSRGWSETAWSGAGSGCSTQNAKPSWQTSATQCSGKANADVSAVADPNTGVAVYDSTPYQGYSGWQVYGGTSASSPIIASVYTMAGNLSGYPASYTWAHATGLNDVTSGSNGSCSTSVWCHSGTGWDGPTGLGTPNGTSSF